MKNVKDIVVFLVQKVFNSVDLCREKYASHFRTEPTNVNDQ